MKKIIGFLLLFFLFASAGAQRENFFRVYNLKGKKVNKGEIFQLSDTSITLTRKNMFVETPVSQIDVIKSKRTTGHKILRTTLYVVGGVVFLVAIVYAHAHDGPRNSYINQGTNKHKSTGGNGKALGEKIQRPQKNYKVHGDAELWKEHRKFLSYQLL